MEIGFGILPGVLMGLCQALGMQSSCGHEAATNCFTVSKNALGQTGCIASAWYASAVCRYVSDEKRVSPLTMMMIAHAPSGSVGCVTVATSLAS